VTGLSEDAVVPVIGTKEAIASLPMDLGIHADSLVVIPELAYPTYEVSAKLAGCRVLRADSLLKLGPETPALIYLNSPANPHGAVLGVEHLRKVVDFARQRDCIVVSDECYLGLGWEATEVADAPVSILDPRVCDGDHRNLIAVHSLSKTSNMASYRAGWLAGDRQLMAEILGIRKHAGGMVPGPIQHAMIAALSSDDFETLQRQRYRERREVLLAGLDAAGFTVEHSEAGLYIWATEGRDAWETVGRFAELGILVAPGHFYGPGRAPRRLSAWRSWARACYRHKENGLGSIRSCFRGRWLILPRGRTLQEGPVRPGDVLECHLLVVLGSRINLAHDVAQRGECSECDGHGDDLASGRRIPQHEDGESHQEGNCQPRQEGVAPHPDRHLAAGLEGRAQFDLGEHNHHPDHQQRATDGVEQDADQVLRTPDLQGH